MQQCTRAGLAALVVACSATAALAAGPAGTAFQGAAYTSASLLGAAATVGGRAPTGVPAGAALQVPPVSITGFDGITDGENLAVNGGQGSEPPDPGIAVNNGKVLEVVNNSIQIFSATGRPLSRLLSSNTFFGKTTPTANSMGR